MVRVRGLYVERPISRVVRTGQAVARIVRELQRESSRVDNRECIRVNALIMRYIDSRRKTAREAFRARMGPRSAFDG
jgi:hypothetical protein